MTTYTALTTTDDEDRAIALGEAIERMTPEPVGVGTFEIEDGSGLWEIGAYFIEKPPVAILELLSLAFQAKPFVVSEVPDIDWVSKVRRDLSPVDAGRFFVFGSHDADKIPPNRVPLQIEATVAFGTGHHGTTLGCLLMFDDLLTRGMHLTSVADIGCGTAVLGMAAAAVLQPEARIIVSDIDEVAVDVAKANLDINKLTGRVKCVEAAGFEHSALQSNAPYDLVFANILKPPLIALAPDMEKYITSGGFAILSGLLTTQAPEIIAAYVNHGFAIEKQSDIGDWATLLLKKTAL